MSLTVEWTGSLSVAWVTYGSNCPRDNGFVGLGWAVKRGGVISDFLTWLFFSGSPGRVINSRRVRERGAAGGKERDFVLTRILTPALNGIHKTPNPNQQLLCGSSWCPFNKPFTEPTHPYTSEAVSRAVSWQIPFITLVFPLNNNLFGAILGNTARHNLGLDVENRIPF